MLLAPTLGSPPRDVAGRVGDELAQQLGGHLARFEVAGPGFLNLFLSDDWHVDALGYVLDAADAFGAGGARPARADQHRVRLGQPDRAAARRPRAQRRVRRRAGAAAHVRRPRRRARVLRQRLRLADRAAGRVAAGAGARRGRARGRLRRRLRDRRWRPRSTARPTWISTSSADAGSRATSSTSATSLERFRVSFDIWFSERSLHTEPVGDDSDAVAHAFAALDALGQTYTQRGRAVAAHVGPRRGQGPRARALDRRAHVLRLRHRLPPEQARARLRAADRRVGRRPPRLRAADEGGLRGAGRRPRRARADHHAVRPPRRPRRRAGVDVQAGGRVRDARRAGRRDRRRRGALVPAVALARHDDRPRSRSRGAARAPRTPSTTCSTRTRGSSRSGARPARLRCPTRRRRASTCTRPSAS